MTSSLLFMLQLSNHHYSYSLNVITSDYKLTYFPLPTKAFNYKTNQSELLTRLIDCHVDPGN